MYEIMSKAREPWEGFTIEETKAAVKECKSLELPACCPVEMKKYLRERIFCKDPAMRYSILEVCNTIEKVIALDPKDGRTMRVNTKKPMDTAHTMEKSPSSEKPCADKSLVADKLPKAYATFKRKACDH